VHRYCACLLACVHAGLAFARCYSETGCCCGFPAHIRICTADGRRADVEGGRTLQSGGRGGGQDDHDCNASEDGRTHARPETAARAALLRSPTRCCSAPCRDGRPSECACPPAAVRGVFPLPAVVPVRRVRCAA